MPDLQRNRLGDIVISLTIAAVILSAISLRFASAQPTAKSSWMQIQRQQQEHAASTSAIRYLCVNHMAFELDPSGGIPVQGENKITVAHEEAKRRCRLPWMPMLRDISTFMSAVSPSNGYGAAFVTTGNDPHEMMQSLNHNGWRESKASKQLRRFYAGYRGYYLSHPGAWMLVFLKKNRDTDRTTAIFAGQWEPGTREQ